MTFEPYNPQPVAGFQTWWGEVNRIARDHLDGGPMSPVAEWGQRYYLKGFSPSDAVLHWINCDDVTPEEIAAYEAEFGPIPDEFPGGDVGGPF